MLKINSISVYGLNYTINRVNAFTVFVRVTDQLGNLISQNLYSEVSLKRVLPTEVFLNVSHKLGSLQSVKQARISANKALKVANKANYNPLKSAVFMRFHAISELEKLINSYLLATMSLVA